MQCCKFFHRKLRDTSIVLAAIACTIWMVPNLQSQPPGGGGPNAPDQLILKDYDKDGDGVLNKTERETARKALESGFGNQRRRGRGRRQMEAGKPGPKVAVADATVHTAAKLYDQSVLRTLFFEFENSDWEKELATFKPTDIEVPAKLTVDGKEYPNVGVSFRGASSFFMIPEGLKRSLNISIDFMDKEQKLYGYKSLNLLNCNGDASMMSSIAYSHLANQHIPAPKVNYLKVVVNGESWGLYVSSQQFNKTFLKENYKTTKGARWKVHGSPRGDGGLRYLGDDVEPYRERYEIKSKDKDASWQALIKLCKTLNETPADQLEEKLSPMLDIEGALWFLAVDVATCNSDGYWTRASDYSIYLHPDGKFHILPHDMNESFQVAGHGGGPGGGAGGRRRGGPGGPPPFGPGPDGPPPEGFDGPPRGFGGEPPREGAQGGRGERTRRGGQRGGGGSRGVELDPLVGLDNERMPLRSVLLKNPKWQRQYLQNLKDIAELLKWENIGPHIKQHRELIEKEVALDTRKLFTTEQFQAATAETKPKADSTSFRAFGEKRSAFLLNHEKIKALSQPKK